MPIWWKNWCEQVCLTLAGGEIGHWYKIMQKSWKITETLAYGYSYESTHRDLSNEYQHDRVQMFFKNLCVLVIWTKVALALDGLTQEQSDFKSYLYLSMEQFASNSTMLSGISLYIASGLSIASVEPRCQSIHSVIQQPGHHWQTLAVMTHCL